MNYVWERVALQSRRHLLWKRPSKYICAALKSDHFRREPSYSLAGGEPRLCDAMEAVSFIKSNDRVFIQGTSATPVPLIKAMVEHGKTAKLQNVELIHILTEGDADYTAKELQGVFRANCLFIGENTRDAVNEGRADYMPIFLSEIPHLFRRNILDIDVALIQTSPPDQHGFCSLGASVDVTRSALLTSKHIIALCNPSMPRTSGDSLVHKSHIDAIVEIDYPLHQINAQQPSNTEKAIGKYIAENLVEDGATLQMGIGSIPNSVLSYLDQHTDLGIHSEMFSDSVVGLFEKGCITNSMKNILPGKIVASFALGSAKLFKFIDNNPSVEMLDISFVNKVETISKNPRVTAINSCLEVDITGQVVSDSIGNKLYSGVGGQIDFIRGAALGYDGLGKPILTTPSLTSEGKSTIVPYIQHGAGVVTTRAHTHYVVTEYGKAFLFGKNLRQRAHALIHIAHPSYRESLEKAAFEILKCMPSP